MLCWGQFYHLKTEWCWKFSTASQCSTTNHPFINGDWEWQHNSLPWHIGHKRFLKTPHYKISIYRKTTHTDQHLSYDSHHPQPVECRAICTTLSLPTTAWGMICFQVWYNTKITLSASHICKDADDPWKQDGVDSLWMRQSIRWWNRKVHAWTD